MTPPDSGNSGESGGGPRRYPVPPDRRGPGGGRPPSIRRERWSVSRRSV